jgi:uncharacterized protein (TIGR02284 family)
MYNDKQIELLNSLIEINNDRILGYKTACADVEDLDLKLLFGQFMQTSEKCKIQLKELVVELGGTPLDDPLTMAIVHRAWIDFKAMINDGDRISILSSCEYGEDVTSTVYKKIFITYIDELSIYQQQILKAQHLLLQAEHEKIKELIILLEKLN